MKKTILFSVIFSLMFGVFATTAMGKEVIKAIETKYFNDSMSVAIAMSIDNHTNMVLYTELSGGVKGIPIADFNDQRKKALGKSTFKKIKELYRDGRQTVVVSYDPNLHMVIYTTLDGGMDVLPIEKLDNETQKDLLEFGITVPKWAAAKEK